MEGATTMGSMKNDDSKKTPASVTITATAPSTAGAPANPPHMKKPSEGSEGHNLLETERTGFNKKPNSIPATKTTSTEGFEPYSGSNQQYAQF
jgi:hypothetical protein